MTAVITLAFDPALAAGPFEVRWETLALAAALFASLLALAAFARAGGRGTLLARLRLDDLFFLAIAAVPGAVVGGRALIALAHLDYYSSHTGALVDPSQGSLSLLGAVAGGTITAAWMARLLGVSVRRWLDAAAVPLLLAIGLGKLAYMLGGGGQGLPWDGPWSVAFVGPGPWLSPSAATPAHPSQAYEAGWNLLGAAIVLALWLRQDRRLAALVVAVTRGGPAVSVAPATQRRPAALVVPATGGAAAATVVSAAGERARIASGGEVRAVPPSLVQGRIGPPPAIVSRSAGSPPAWSILQASPPDAVAAPVEDGPDVAGSGYGRVYAAAVAWFLLGRVLVGFTWADASIVAGLNAEQVAALVVLAPLVLAGMVRAGIAGRATG